jgi:DNA polymerase-3 subunit alpha
MAFVTVEDLHGSVETVVFSSVYQSVSELLVEDRPVLIRGRVQKDDQSVKIIADSIISMEKAEESWTASIHFHLDTTRTDRQTLLNLQETLQRYPGACRAYLHLKSPEGTETIVAVSENIRLQAGSRLIRDVHQLLGYQVVETVCNTAAPDTNHTNNGNRGYYRNGRQ